MNILQTQLPYGGSEGKLGSWTSFSDIVSLNTDGLNYTLQNWSEVFRRELDQLQTWKDHSPHKIAHTSDTTTSSAGPPNRAQVQWFSRRTHRTHWKLLYSCLLLLQGKNRLESEKKKSAEAQTRRSPRGRATRHAFPMESWTLSFPGIDCASTHGVLPTRAASPSISVQSLYSGSITQEWSTAHMASLSLQPLQGLNCVIQTPIITLLVYLEWSASTLNTIWQGPHPRYCVVRPAITQITLLGYLAWPEAPGQTGTPLPGITLKALDSVCLKPRANPDPFLDKFKVFTIQFENLLMTRKQKILGPAYWNPAWQR